MVLTDDRPLLLTDDEVLAIAQQHGTTWPGMLPSVSWDVNARFVAALRGTRSLVIRELAAAPNGVFAVDPELDMKVRAFTEPISSIGMHPTTLADINQFVGAGTFFAVSAFGDAMASVMSAAGVHQFTPHDADIVRPVSNALESLHSAELPAGNTAGVLVYGKPAADEPALWCTAGRVVEGVLQHEPAQPGRLLLDSPADVGLARLREFLDGLMT